MLPTIRAAAQDIRAGHISPIELTQYCLGRIDRHEEQVQAWVLVDREQALADADALAAELRRGVWRGPLHGIPIGIKDIIDVFDWPTACGSKLWAQSVARRDATVVERLRRAGAVLLGKTVTTQYASFDPPKTRNPWNRERTPGGSSSGSAAATACGMCLGALGSQTGGSITRPASYCGVASCKPTWGRVSVDGVLPLAASMDHVGPMAGCVWDLALLLQIIAAPDSRDPACTTLPAPDLLTALARPQSPPRLGRVRGLFEDQAEPPIRQMMDEAVKELQKAGATVVDVALPAGFADVIPRHRTIMAVEGARYHEHRMRRHPEDYLPKVKGLLEEGLACPAPEYARCKEHQQQLSREVLACFESVDALLCPAITGPAPSADSTGNPAFQSPWSYTGLPTISLPFGWSDGLPLAFQLVGRHWSEVELFPVAGWCETVVGLQRKEVG